MAPSLIQNAMQINFDSVLSLSNECMVSMFKALESSGLRGFLGCSAAIYEKDLFAGIFDLPTEGLRSVNDLPANLINEVRRAFSESEELIKASCKKKEMKVEFRPLNENLDKAITAKAITAIHCGIMINWSIFLFDILNEMEETEEEDTDSEDTVSLSKRNWAAVCIDVIQFSIFSHLQPVGSTVNKCTDIVAITIVLSTDTVPTEVLDVVQHGQSIERFVDFFEKLSSDSSTSSSSTSSSDSYIHFSGRDDKKEEIVVVVRSLKMEEDLEVVEAVVNHLRKEVDHTEEEREEVLDLVVGFL
ncbi:hypothetical protein F511_03887 [Dorcoceras hygrometricum]|uniref:Uncharacterized protein n=1 Tax=Dorcoceras hygrometricum TaxID=472368 RepID=A0A2Z7AVX1_9LAMI|nr:hypothetical protein F511_03887 [Dorcoceras hygrometricum]